MKDCRLTKNEKEILNYLVDAWNLFVKLDNKHPSDNQEFQRGIHLCQQKIGMRIARRVNPEIWFDSKEERICL